MLGLLCPAPRAVAQHAEPYDEDTEGDIYVHDEIVPVIGAPVEMRPGGAGFNPLLPDQGPQVIEFTGSPTETALHDVNPPEVRAMDKAVRRFPRIRMKGDAAGNDRIEPRRSWEAMTTEWDENRDGGRPIRSMVTDVRNPNPQGGAAEWTGGVDDPSDFFLRTPGVSDWWF